MKNVICNIMNALIFNPESNKTWTDFRRAEALLSDRDMSQESTENKVEITVY